MPEWNDAQVREWLGKTRFRNYQKIELRPGLVIPGQDRAPTAQAIFRTPPSGKRVLDVGCDYGFFCHEAVRLGASAVTGLEMNPENFAVAQAVAEIKGGPVTIRNGTLEDTEFPEAFDLVLLLNVIHHARDPFAMVRRVAELAKERAVIEFPLLSDPKFLKRTGLSRWFRKRYNRLPYIGVGPSEYHAAYYFTPVSFEHAFVRHAGLFRSVRFEPSPSFPDRMLAFCAR